MLESEVHSMLAVMEEPEPTEDSLARCARQVLFAAAQSDHDQRQAALDRLARVFENYGGAKAGYLSVICGALVEHGCDPAPLASPLFLRIQDILPKAIELCQRCESRSSEYHTGDATTATSDSQFKTVLERRSDEFPDLAAAWTDPDRFGPATVAVLSTSSQWRAMAHCFQQPLQQIMHRHQAARWIARLLAVIDDGQLLVIEPATLSGWPARISGVADNFQLQTLLMGTTTDNGLDASSALSSSALDVARGIGPQQSPEEVVGRWNFYSWQALQPDLQLPIEPDSAGQKHKILDAGLPAEIPLFAGHHVLLLGPRTSPHCWASQRSFGHLKASLDCEPALDPESCREWLNRMLQRSRPDGETGSDSCR